MAQLPFNYIPLPPLQGGTGLRAMPAGNGLLVGRGTAPLGNLPVANRGDVVFTDGTSWRTRRGGRILQVLYAGCAIQQTATINGWTRIGPWTGNQITPRRANSTILVLASINIVKTAGVTHTRLQLLRNSEALPLNYGSPAGYRNGIGGVMGVGTISFSATDTPNTITPVTYNIDFYNFNTLRDGANTTIAQWGGETSTMILMELAHVG